MARQSRARTISGRLVQFGRDRLCPDCKGQGTPYAWVKGGRLIRQTCGTCQGTGVLGPETITDQVPILLG